LVGEQVALLVTDLLVLMENIALNLLYSADNFVVFFAGSVIEDRVATCWQRLPTETRAGLQTALQSTIQRRLLGFAPFARTKLVDAFIRVVERTWPTEFPDFLDWIAKLLRESGTTEVSVHLLEAFVANCTGKSGRRFILAPRRQELERLILRSDSVPGAC
jgi:hypothetical protein